MSASVGSHLLKRSGSHFVVCRRRRPSVRACSAPPPPPPPPPPGGAGGAGGGYFVYYPPAAPSSSPAPASDPSIAAQLDLLTKKVDLLTSSPQGLDTSSLSSLKSELALAKTHRISSQSELANSRNLITTLKTSMKNQEDAYNSLSLVKLAQHQETLESLKSQLKQQEIKHAENLQALAVDFQTQQSKTLQHTRSLEEEIAYSDPDNTSSPLDDAALTILSKDSERLLESNSLLQTQVTALESKIAQIEASSSEKLATQMKESAALLAAEQAKANAAAASAASAAAAAAAAAAAEEQLREALAAATLDFVTEKTKLTEYARSLEEQLAYVDDDEDSEDSKTAADSDSTSLLFTEELFERFEKKRSGFNSQPSSTEINLAKAREANSKLESELKASRSESSKLEQELSSLRATLESMTREVVGERENLVRYTRQLEEELAYVDDGDDSDVVPFVRNPPGTFQLKKRVNKMAAVGGEFQRNPPGTFQLKKRVNKMAAVGGGFQRNPPGTFQLKKRVNKLGAVAAAASSSNSAPFQRNPPGSFQLKKRVNKLEKE
ncbi:hypothetical protein NFJ02_10g02500 [Pycnococcus provasolii]